ncbi:tetratricopeptide repeat protein [Aquimarina celericrescens]|uniref:Tetratricopeptide repeat protein n=1 Tax=Aquimarina celericrescens TaxID=1964542 RepID=A0ABW5ATP5_9FLAO|nr:tetratricopeptide repeat protein [Aquimarina celericrescens]
MSRLILSFVFFVVSIASCFAQEMQQGFEYLETGEYDKAEVFFKQILEQYPTNRTARLCYGRAVGLTGDSKQAVTIFTNLLKEYPYDFEIKLNYAESLLWDKQFDKAEVFYEKLIEEKSDSFPAVLGYANTLSNLQKYEKALAYVNKALEIQEGNQNAMISRKYMRLGYANELSQDRKYGEALRLLDQNLLDFPNDKDTQLNKGNIYLITNNLTEAEKVYATLAVNPKDSIVSLNNLALVAHKKHKEKEALGLSTLARDRVEKFKNDKELYLSTQERYIQALLWNRKFKAASEAIDRLKSLYPDDARVLALQATSGMYTSNFDTSIQNYRAILVKQRSSFDGNLGIANAYRALGEDMKSYTYAFKTLQYYPRQQDAEKLIEKLKKSHTPHIEEKTAFTFDNGDNEAVNLTLKTEIPLSVNFKSQFQYDYRTTKNTITNNEATSNDFWLGFLYKYNGSISLQSKIGVTNADGFTTSYTALIAETVVKIKPFRLQNLDIGYKRELQNFNADLLNREIIMNNYSINYNLGTNFNLGWYTQYMYTSQTDDNIRNLLFTSLYYTILQRPVLKAGINYQYIAFKNQVPTIYFSPERFNLGELFIEVVSDPEKQWFYNASAAFGQQYVENDPGSSTFRAEGKLGHQSSNRFKANLYGKYSNIASATAAGFEYVEFGFQLKWYFLKQPVFNKKIIELKK